MEKRTRMIPVKKEMICDKCGGIMVPTGMCLMSNPPQYPHVCNGCGFTATYNKSYPTIEFEEEENTNEM